MAKDDWKAKYEREVAAHAQTRTMLNLRISHLHRRIGTLIDAMERLWTDHVHM